MAPAAKIRGLKHMAKECAKTGRYFATDHADQRMKEREIDFYEVEDILINGYHCRAHDKWDERYQNWKYGFCGKTLAGRNLRLAITIQDQLFIITVIDEDSDGY